MQVKQITDKSVLLLDEHNNLRSLSDVNFVMQFELDRPFQGFQPYYYYEVSPESNL